MLVIPLDEVDVAVARRQVPLRSSEPTGAPTASLDGEPTDRGGDQDQSEPAREDAQATRAATGLSRRLPGGHRVHRRRPETTHAYRHVRAAVDGCAHSPGGQRGRE